jgi:hypothetical protein
MSAEVLQAKLGVSILIIPAGINSASVQRVREYKKWVGQARKAINSGTKNEQVLQSLLSQYEAYK